MIKDINELNFPKYATLETATATIADMGDRTITSQVKIDGDVVPDFSYDWEVEFKGERYIHPVRTPQGTKDNSSLRAKIDLVFQHWAIYEMKREFFVEMASTSAGTAIADKYIASLGLNLEDFIVAFNLVLNHYFGGRIIINLNPNPLQPYSKEAKFVSISYSYIWDVLQQTHEIYGVRWTLKTNADGVCEILMGYPAEEVSHIFEYGFEGGLLSVQRQVQSTEIRNRLLGRGGSKNLPHRYFKDKDPNNPLFEADPDWIPELADIVFTELRGKTFRDYVRGWKANRYGGTPMAEPTEAYLAGYNAEKFDPIEYVDDKESIEKYGVLVGALENNEEIYPSIQGAPGDVDIIVDAEQVTDDDVDAAVENDSVTTNLESGHQTYRNAPANSTITIETLTKRYFSVPADKVGNLDMSLTVTGKYSNFGDYEETYPILKADTVKITIYDRNTDATITSSTVPVINIPAGDYYYMISADVETNYDKTSMVTLNIESVHLIISTPDKSEGWTSTFDIWVRNIWGSERNVGETDQQYADRVWFPILGDRMGDEARVVFASGWLSFSSDWEFPIVGYAFDNSKTDSHWRLTLAKSKAELEASGKHIPYEGYNASAGDRFFFIGIDLPHQYVLWGEERVDDYKRDRLPETSRINPSWVIKADKVRLNQDREGAVLVDSLNAGAQIRLASKQFISGAYESLYVQSMTYNWTSDTILYPDVEIVVSDKVVTVKNPVAQIRGSIETLQRQVGSLSNIQQIIRQVCDQLYLRKDGVEDLSKSPTRFLGKVTGKKFRQGRIGGRDWGIYRDENGNAILEADKLVARQGILVSDLVVNEATYVGGLQINSAAAMKITAVEETENGYICYFDQQQGSVTNKFKVDDVALCQKFDPEDNEVKYYKRRVVAIAETSVTLSKTDVNGDGVPAVDDEIIHYGNYTDKTRQFVIIRDVIGGGYERMLMGLDSVISDGVEYYFAGKSADSTARWFVGGTEQFAEYKDGQLTIKGNIFVTGSDKNISEQLAQIDFIREAFGENAQGLVLGTAIIVGYTDENENFVPMAGLSGVYDKNVENGGPAAWYGGTPEDAKSVIFMDGTGYFADGLFKWDKDKGVNLGNGAIKINYDGSVEFGGNIRIGNTGEETLDSLLTIVAGLTDMWYLDDDGNVRTKHNVVIEGDTSSGGEGEDTPSVGLDEEQLQAYLDEHRYVTEDDIAGLIPDVDLSDYYTSEQTDSAISTAIANLINGAPTTLDTLKEIADALAENEDVVEALEAAIGTKANASDVYTKSQIDAEFEDYETALATKAAKSDLTALTNKHNVLQDDFDVLESTVNSLKGTVSSHTTNIGTLQGYFSNGIAKKATADASGNVITTYYTPITTHNALATRVGAAETNITNLTNNKANKATTLAGYGITNAYTKTEIDTKVTAINNTINGVSGRVTTLETWKSDISKYITIVNGNVKISTNLIVTGDTSSGGSGEDTGAEGTVTGVIVGTTKYESVSAGLLDLTSLMALYTPVSTHNILAGRVTALEGKATAVSFTQTLTSGTKIGTITIDGVGKNIYTPTIPTAIKNPHALSWSGYSSGSYDGSAAKSITIPSNTNQLTNGAGFITGITKSMVDNALGGTASSNANKFLMCTGSTTVWSAVTKRMVATALGASTGGRYLIDTGGDVSWGTIPTKLSQFTDDVVSGKYLPISGGTLGGELKINPSHGAGSFYVFNSDDTYRLTHIWDGNTARLYNITNDGSSYGVLNLQGTIQINGNTAIHAGNIGSYNAGSATKLATARTIWGQSFDGTGNVTGNITLGKAIGANLSDTWTDNNGNTHPWYGLDFTHIGTWTTLSSYFGIVLKTASGSIYLNSSGNVLIGTTDDSGAKLNVNGNVTARSADANTRHVIAENSLGKASIYVAASGNRGLFDFTKEQWLIYTDGTNTYIPSKPVTIAGAVTMSNELFLGNNKGIYFKNTSGTNVLAMYVSPSNVLQVGYNNVDSVAFQKPVTMSSTLSVAGGVSTPVVYGGTKDSYNWRLISDVSTNAIWLQAGLTDKTSNSGKLYLSGLNAELLTYLHLYAIETTARTLRPSSNSAYTLGTSSYRWSTIYGTHGNFSASVTATTSVVTPLLQASGGLAIVANGSAAGSRLFLTSNCFRPWGDDSKLIDLGSSSIQWRNLYAVGATFSGDVTINGNLIVKGDTSSGGTAEDTSGNGETMKVFSEALLQTVNGTTKELENGMYSYRITAAVGLNFLNVKPADTSKPCVIHLVKGGSYSLTIPVESTSGCVVTSAEGAKSTTPTVIPQYKGVTLVWDTYNGVWNVVYHGVI